MVLEETPIKGNSFWEFAENQILDEFIPTIELKVESDCPDLWANISSVDNLAPEKLIWYTAKYWDTLWKADDNLIGNMESSKFLPSITLAENPSFVQGLPMDLLDQVIYPENLAKYDAVNPAKTLFDLEAFPNAKLEEYKAVKISKLKKLRKDLGFNVFSAVENGDVDTLDRCITEGVWAPINLDLYNAVYNNSDAFLLYLSGKMKKVPCWTGYSNIPSVRYISLLEHYGRLDVINNILSVHPDWKPSQYDINDAVHRGLETALEVYASIDPNLPPPTEAAVLYAIRSKEWPTFEFCLNRWPHVYNSLKLGGRGLEQAIVSELAERGYVKALQWNSKVHRNAFLPSKGSLNRAFDVLKWRASINPAWTVDPEEIKAAIARRDIEMVTWHKNIAPCCDSSDKAFDADAA